MGRVVIQGSTLGNALSELLGSEDIVPGDQVSYELAKTIWLYHPLGKKIVEAPIQMAQSQAREISVTDGPESRVRDRFVQQWEEDKAEDVIYQVASVARAYGIATLALVCQEVPANQPVDPKKLADLSIAFSVFDPLNTAGSLVLNQDPNAVDFMKVKNVAVGGVPYHFSRTVTLMNERPVYIAYTSSAFGFVGRSVFQRSLFPLKSFIQSMVTDDLITKKAGVFIAMLKAAGAIIDNVMSKMAGLKRLFVQQATNGNVISIGADEKIETLNMQNIDGAYGMARKNILENIATGADMPAIILKQETFAEGFGEGTEDAKMVARFVDEFRRWLRPAYKFMERIEMHRAWNRDFFESIQKDYPEYRGVRYEDALYRWINSFSAEWPSLLTEPDSEKVKTDDVKLKAIIATVEVFGPMLDPENKATLLMWAESNLNENKMMFQSPLALDFDALAAYVPPQQEGADDGEKPGDGSKEPSEPKPFADSAILLRDVRERLDAIESDGRRMRRLDDDQLAELVAIMARRPENLPAPIHLHVNGHANGHAVGDDASNFKEGDHPRKKGGEGGGQFTSKGGEGSASAKEPAAAEKKIEPEPDREAGGRASESTESPSEGEWFKTKKDQIGHLLRKGTTTEDILKATGWPSVSVPAQARALGFKLEKFKDGRVTKYKGTPMTAAEMKAAGITLSTGARGPQARDQNTWSISEYLAYTGGIDPSDPLVGDIRSILGTKNKFIPGFGPLIRKGGMRLDLARETANEAGYLESKTTRGNADTTTVRTLLDALSSEFKGRKIYKQGVDVPTELDRGQHLRDIETHLDSELEQAEIDLASVPENIRNRTIEIMDREHEADALVAYERAVMEQSVDDETRIDDFIPGWDVPDDASAASRTS